MLLERLACAASTGSWLIDGVCFLESLLLARNGYRRFIGEFILNLHLLGNGCRYGNVIPCDWGFAFSIGYFGRENILTDLVAKAWKQFGTLWECVLTLKLAIEEAVVWIDKTLDLSSIIVNIQGTKQLTRK